MREKSEGKIFQEELHGLLKGMGLDAVLEWSAFQAVAPDLPGSKYSPRVDIAIGPWNLAYEDKRITGDDASHPFVAKLHKMVEPNNSNPRCLVAIEVSFSGTRKHIMGDIVNASLLGYIGVVVASGNGGKRTRDRIREYLRFAYNVGKSQFDLGANVAILTPEEMQELIHDAGQELHSAVGARGRA